MEPACSGPRIEPGAENRIDDVLRIALYKGRYFLGRLYVAPQDGRGKPSFPTLRKENLSGVWWVDGARPIRNSFLHIGRSVYVFQSNTNMGVNDTSFVNQAIFEKLLVITMQGKSGGVIYPFGVRRANEVGVIILGFVDGVVILWPTCECGEEGARHGSGGVFADGGCITPERKDGHNVV